MAAASTGSASRTAGPSPFRVLSPTPRRLARARRLFIFPTRHCERRDAGRPGAKQSRRRKRLLRRPSTGSGLLAMTGGGRAFFISVSLARLWRMQAYELELRGERATREAGRTLGGFLRDEPIGERAFVLALEGELGAGKTTFVRGLARGLGIREKITSPSFLIAKCYAVPSLLAPYKSQRDSTGRGAQRRGNPRKFASEIASLRDARRPFARNDAAGRVLWHFDFYRLQRPTRRDLDLLDFQQILSDPANIVAIEWAERVRKFLTKQKLALHFGVTSQKMRQLIISAKLKTQRANL